MNVIIGGRASGKTHQLVQWYKEDPEHRRIITGDAMSMKFLIEDYGVDKRHVFSVLDPIRIAGHNGEFGLDFDMDWYLRTLLHLDGVHQRLGPVTINGAAKDASTGEVISRSIANPRLRPRDIDRGNTW